MTYQPWVALHGMAHSFIELCKPLHHNRAVNHEGDTHTHTHTHSYQGKNLPAMQETLVQLLGCEDPLEKGYATHSTINGFPWWIRW